MERIRRKSVNSSTSANSVGTKAQKVLRRVGDKVRVGVALFDDIAKSLAKATNHDKVPPKEKHVRKIILATHGPSSELNYGELVDAMSRIVTQSRDWLVSIKGLQLFHRVIQEGSEEFVETILRHQVSKVLNMSAWKDRSTAVAMEQSPFVRQYARYVEERVILYRNVQIKQLEPSMQLPLFSTVKAHEEEFFRLISSMQRLTDELLECYHLLEDKRSRLENAATIGAFNLLLDDALALYKLLSDANLKLLDIYFDMDKVNAGKAIRLYEKHCQQTQELLNFFKFAKKTGVSRRNIPALKSTPDSILEAMKEYLNGGGSDGDGSRRVVTQLDHNFDDIDIEVPTMNLADILSKQEMDFINNSVPSSSTTTAGRSDEDTSTSTHTEEGSPRTTSSRPRRPSAAATTRPSANKQSSPSMLEFDDFLGPSTTNNNSNGRSNNNNGGGMINFDDFLTSAVSSNGTPNTPQHNHQQNNMMGYGGPARPMSYQQPPQQQQQPQRRPPSQQFQQPYYNAPHMAPPPQQNWGPGPYQPQQPLPPHMANHMQRQQEMVQKQQFFRQQYLQSQQQQQLQPNQPKFGSSPNPFDDPFDMPMTPDQQKQQKSANVLGHFDF